MLNPVRVGIIGMGRSGWMLHAQGIEKNERFCIAAVMDPDPVRCSEAKERFSCPSYGTAKELLASPEVELVVIATPSHTHASLSMEALQAGKHVLVEKPMAADAKEARCMVECARRAGKTLTAYQVRRLDGDFVKIREIVESGVLGPLHTIKLTMHFYQRRSDWQTLQCFSGGILNNLGAHFIDQAVLLAGGQWSEPYVDMRRLVSSGDAEDHVKVLFRGAGSVLVDVEISGAVATPPPPRWTILGRYGGISGSTNHIKWRYYDPSAVKIPEVVTAAPELRGGPPEILPWIEAEVDIDDLNDGTQPFYNQLYAMLREGAPSPAPGSEICRLIAFFDECRKMNKSTF